MTDRRDYPLKRRPRPRRDTYRKPNHMEVLRELLDYEFLHLWAAQFDQREGTNLGGRPVDHPVVVKLIFGIMAWEWGGQRAADREISEPSTWAIVSDALRGRYPEWKCFRPGGKPIDRFDYARFRNRHGIDDDTLSTLTSVAEAWACDQAQSMGQLTASCGGSISHPSPRRIASGDGTVLALRYKTPPGALHRNTLTGELDEIRHDPDADDYITGDGRHVRGHNFVLVESRSDHEDERVLLSVTHQPKQHPGGEGAIAIEVIRRLRPLLPDLQGITWDKALRGKHIEELYDLGLQPIIKVAKDKGGTLKSRRVGSHRVAGATDSKIEVYAQAGAIGIQVPVGGELVFVRCPQTKRMSRRTRRGVTWFAAYRIPDKAPVPPSLRNGRFHVRLNGRGKTDPPSLNRSEIIRAVAECDPEWKPLYARRPGSESTNAWFKARLPNRRCPAVGAPRNRFEMLCMQVFANLRALIAFKRRAGIPPPLS